jgi:hypothetical protein
MKTALPLRNGKTPAVVTFRPDQDVAKSLERLAKDKPIRSLVINECLREWLNAHGYGNTKQTTI